MHRFAPKLILIDYSMPALRGDKLIKIAQGGGLKTPMVLYSTAPDRQLQGTAQKSGAAGSIRKDATAEVLVSKINEHLLATAST